MSYHIAQYTNIIADLRKEIFRLKLKISEHDTESNDGNSSSKFLKDNTLSYQLSLIEVIIIKHVIDFSVPMYSFYFLTSCYVERKRKDIIACKQAILGPPKLPRKLACRLRTLACKKALVGALAVGREKEGELATMSLEFEFHLQFLCVFPLTELSDFGQSARNGNKCECKQTLKIMCQG